MNGVMFILHGTSDIYQSLTSKNYIIKSWRGIMFKQLTIMLSCLSVIFLITGCNTKQKPIKLTMKNNNSTVQVQPNTEFTVELKTNPTTGYLWKQLSENNQSIKLEKTAFKIKDAKLIGSGGTRTLIYKTLIPAQTTLKLGYLRPWEKDVPPIKVFSVKIVVNKK